MAKEEWSRPEELPGEGAQPRSSREPKLVPITTKQGPELVRVIETPADCDWLVNELAKEAAPVGLDTETEGIDPTSESPAAGRGRVVCWSLSTSRHRRIFLWAAPESHAQLKAWLESDAPKVGHNIISFDAHMFRNHGIHLGGIHCDTLRLHQLVFTQKTISKSLKSLMHYWLGLEPVGEFKNLFRRRRGFLVETDAGAVRRKIAGKTVLGFQGTAFSRLMAGWDTIKLQSIPDDYPHLLETLYDYATLDALATRLLYEKLRPYVESLPGDLAAGSPQDCSDGSSGDWL